MLLDYLKTEYGENTPILVSEIRIEGMTENNIRQQMKRLSDSGMVRRYDKGIYYIPKKSVFKSGTLPSYDAVIEKKFLMNGKDRCGYVSGATFANRIGVSTQVPMEREVVTNKATKDYREVELAGKRVIVRKPRTEVDDRNYKPLQLLDLIKDIDSLAELAGSELVERVRQYMEKAGIAFQDLAPWLALYPDKLYKNLYEMRIINGIFA